MSEPTEAELWRKVRAAMYAQQLRDHPANPITGSDAELADNIIGAMNMLSKVVDEVASSRDLLARTPGVLRGMLRIAEIAMPDTFFATDSRVRAAKALLEDLTGGKPPTDRSRPRRVGAGGARG